MTRIPKSCEMGDIADLSRHQAQLVTALFAGYDSGVTREFRLYRRVLVRLVDKSLLEYTWARELILAQIAEGERPTDEMTDTARTIHLFSFTDHMENCLNALCRTFKVIEALKAVKDTPTVERPVRKLIRKSGETVSGLRNVIEHIDSAIALDEIGEDNPVMLCISADGKNIEIGSLSISLLEVERLIRRIHSLVGEMIRVDGRISVT